MVAREPEDRRELEALRGEVGVLAGELAQLRRDLELEHCAVVGLEERQELIYKSLQREGAIPRRPSANGAAHA
jgi:hypothetical protein